MNGKAHAATGLVVGLGVSYFSGLDLTEGAIVTTATTAASLAPDLDTAGTLANKVVRPFQTAINVIYSLLFFLFVNLFMRMNFSKEAVIGALTLIVAGFLIKRIPVKIQLLIMSFAIGMVGFHFEYYSIVWVGSFIAIAALLPHRSYTHSILGLLFFVYISYQLQSDFQINNLFLGLVLGFISHFVLDSRFIPGNKMGVKLFMPFSNKQF